MATTKKRKKHLKNLKLLAECWDAGALRATQPEANTLDLILTEVDPEGAEETTQVSREIFDEVSEALVSRLVWSTMGRDVDGDTCTLCREGTISIVRIEDKSKIKCKKGCGNKVTVIHCN
jgi:hypothetical protein